MAARWLEEQLLPGFPKHLRIIIGHKHRARHTREIGIRSISATLPSDRKTGAFENKCVRGLMKVAQKSGSPTSRSSDSQSASRSSVTQKHSWLKRSETGRIVIFES